jgi:hypothetical protein
MDQKGRASTRAAFLRFRRRSCFEYGAEGQEKVKGLE